MSEWFINSKFGSPIFNLWWCVFTKEGRDYAWKHHRGDYDYITGIRRAWCRMHGHPAGVWFYNPNRMEPDMHCKNCGDDIG